MRDDIKELLSTLMRLRDGGEASAQEVDAITYGVADEAPLAAFDAAFIAILEFSTDRAKQIGRAHV